MHLYYPFSQFVFDARRCLHILGSMQIPATLPFVPLCPPSCCSTGESRGSDINISLLNIMVSVNTCWRQHYWISFVGYATDVKKYIYKQWWRAEFLGELSFTSSVCVSLTFSLNKKKSQCHRYEWIFKKQVSSATAVPWGSHTAHAASLSLLSQVSRGQHEYNTKMAALILISLCPGSHVPPWKETSSSPAEHN